MGLIYSLGDLNRTRSLSKTFSFPDCLQAGTLVFFSYILLEIWIEQEVWVRLSLSLTVFKLGHWSSSDMDWNLTIDLPDNQAFGPEPELWHWPSGYSAFWLQILEFLSLCNQVDQIFIINFFLINSSYWFCFSGKPRLI